MSNISAGIGCGQIEVLDESVTLRREIHDFYKKVFVDIEEVSVFEQPNEDYFSNYWLSTILIEEDCNKKINRETLRLAFEEATLKCVRFRNYCIYNLYSSSIPIMEKKKLKIYSIKGCVCLQDQTLQTKIEIELKK